MKKLGLFALAVLVVVLLFTLIGGRGEDGGLSTPAFSTVKIDNPAAVRKGNLVVTCPAYSGNFNPLYLTEPIDKAITRLLFDPLVEPSADGTPTPVLADYTVSADQRTYTFTIREDALFSDGSEVTAQDVAFTWCVLYDPAYDGHLLSSRPALAGADAYTKGEASSISGIEVVDEKTISATLTEPDASAIFTLGVAPLSKAYYGADYEPGKLDSLLLQLSRPMGCGQYSLTDLTMQQLTFSRCKDYYLGEPACETVTFTVADGDSAAAMLLQGESDLDLTGGSAQINADDYDYLIRRTFAADSMGMLGFSLVTKELVDPVARQAIALCVDRQALIDAVLPGEASVLDLPVSQESWAFPQGQSAPACDPAAAAALLEQNGYTKNSSGYYQKDGLLLQVVYTTTQNNPVSEALAQQLSENLPKAGIRLTVRSTDYATLLNQIEVGRAELWFMAYGASPDPDPSTLVASDGAFNLFSYANPSADSLLSLAKQQQDTSRRADLYSQVWEQLEQNPPFVVLYQRQEQAVCNIRCQELTFCANRPVTADFYLLKDK